MAKISDISTYLKAAKELNLNLGMIGAHGRAKTAVVKEYADNMGYELITKILASIEPTDMVGLPTEGKYVDNSTSVTKNAYPEWLVTSCDPNRNIILFFDEFNNAEKDVQSAILNLIEDRKYDDLKLSDTTQIIVAFNPPSIAPNGRRLAKATRDRLCIIPIEDDKQSFKQFFNNNDMEIVSQIIDELDPVMNYDEEVTKYAYENAEFTYRSLNKAYNIVKYCVENKVKDNIGIQLVCGYGGNNGQIVYKEMKNKLLEAGEKNNFKSVIEGGDKKKIVEFIRTNQYFENLLDFNKTVRDVKFIEESLSKDDFNWVLNQIFNEEFIQAYKSI